MARNTGTGKQYEDIVRGCIDKACRQNGIIANPQVVVGTSPSGRKHRIDWELVDTQDPSIRALLSCKTQSRGGTAEEKVPYEVIKLLHAMQEDTRYHYAWLVLGGAGWSEGLKDFYQDELTLWLPSMAGRISIITTTSELASLDLTIPR